MRGHHGRICATLLIASFLGAPAAAQTAGCDSCASTPHARRNAIEQARQKLETATQIYEQRRAAWFDNDTSRAAQDALDRAEQELIRAQHEYQMRQMEVIRTQVRMAEQAMRSDMQRARAMQRDDQRGWLGITLSSNREEGSQRGFPLIVAVDPDSPARRAGLEAGDVLVAVNGHTLQKGSPTIEHLLVPGSRVPMRVQRGDETKTVTVLVGRKPHGGGYMFRFGPDRDSSDVELPEAVVSPMPPMPPSAPLPVIPPAPAAAWAPAATFGAPLTSFYFNGIATIAGAQLWDVDDLRSYFHVDDGLLVLRVLPGTPADRAGLRSGDVIVRTDGREMSTIRLLERALANADSRSGAHSVQLSVVRKGKRIPVALRW